MNELHPVALKDLLLQDPLFGHYVEKMHTQMIPYQWEVLNDRAATGAKSGCLHNMRVAAGLETGEYYGMVFQDSDLAKWLEGAAYSLQTRPDAALEARMDACVDLLAQVQQPDGYLNTYYTIKEPGKRWTNLMECHELYCAGHMIEAAVAYYEATGKRKFLDVMCRYVDLIDRTFGPGPEQKQGYPGHEEIELALVKLYRVTGDEKHLRLATYFVNQRGQQPNYFTAEMAENGNHSPFFDDLATGGWAYMQAKIPPRDQREVEGHAVRAMYLCCAMADLAMENHDDGLRTACEALFQDVVRRKMYITGGIGSAEYGERFTAAFDLPNDTCYCETCASIGLALFALRMCRLTRDASYADVMERALYNTMLAGVDRAGDHFFYVNPLEVTPSFCKENGALRHVKVERQQWFDCACCPTNVVRTLGSLGQYVLAENDREVFVNLYLPCEATLAEGNALTLTTDYPRGGEIHITCDFSGERALYLRIPAHSPLLSLAVNGRPITPEMDKGYAKIICPAGRTEVALRLDVRPCFVYADPRVSADCGKVALIMGPLVYCFEQVDNGENLAACGIDVSTEPSRIANPVDPASDALRVSGWKAHAQTDALYTPVAPVREPCTLTAVPYYCWNNRGVGEMRVWMRA